MALDDIIIYGTGGNSRDILETLEAINQERRCWNILGFIDDDRHLFGKEVMGFPVLGDGEHFRKNWALRNTKIILALGNDTNTMVRKTIRERIGLEANRFPVLIHPRAIVSRQSQISEGVIFLSGSFCSNFTKVGRHVMVLQNTIISHDAVVGDYVSFSASVTVGGGVQIGEGTYIGLGATILPGIQIGIQSRIGIGTVVVRQVPDYATVLGNPAQIVRIQKQ